ncbi:MAG TPA: glycosyltransferase, partial [Verrucomicrobiae bacterium]|nr:glycosyltransferase [Verrucomicrobiae bacterium]
KAKFVFTQLELGLKVPVVRFQLGRCGGTDFANPETLHYTRNSPYVAVCLAVQMGATRIGLIGVDFTDHHFFAATGRHPLAGSLSQIDEEYRKLGKALALRGIELVNLSSRSRLTSLPKQEITTFVPTQPRSNSQEAPAEKHEPKVFFVHYRFLSCGDVFRKGLMHAADHLKTTSAEAYWDDAKLESKVREFNPDLLFVVHGRRFSGQWKKLTSQYRSAVWLLDEPYEVDDTSKFSTAFEWTFVNDPSTLSRHKNSHYLPTCFDPQVHFDSNGPRSLGVGFIGGANRRRERLLAALAERGLLDYVVGGPWQNARLNRLSRGRNIPESQTAELYQKTKIVINIFREQHHFNRERLPATSLNPRVYEALACGALVISEPRPELETCCPSLPVFRDEAELSELIKRFLGDEEQRRKVQRECAAAVARDTYSERLCRVLSVCGLSKLPPQKTTEKSAPVEVPAPPVERIETPHAPVPRPSVAVPFSAMPRRNLIYHVWPVRDSIWRWNIEQLLKRIDIFNGRRIVGIVHDSKSEPPEAVMRALDGHGCEFVVRDNGPAGEALTFPEMLSRVAGKDPNEVTFYGHAKGVKYGRQCPPAVRRWAETLYLATLDDWLSVSDQLQHFAMTGPFKMRGRFRAHRESSDWHYSGTFFWMRNCHVFSRAWQAVPQFYCGVEAWPGTLFRAEETGCLLLDGLRSLPYLPSFWRGTGDKALKEWNAKRKLVPIPASLADPRPPEGESGPRLEQTPDEFKWLVNRLIGDGVRRVLTVNGGHGGAEWWLARAFHQASRPLELTTLQPAPTGELRTALADASRRFGATIHLVESHSQMPDAASRLSAPYDALFSDGERSYARVKADWNLALAINAKQVAFHDIVDSDWHVQCRCCVSRLWEEIKLRYPSSEQSSSNWGGVGVINTPASI